MKRREGERERDEETEKRKKGDEKSEEAKTKSRAEHVAVKGVADGIIGSFLSPCTTRPRFSFTSTSCHFVLARDGYTTRYVFPPSFASLKIYDRLIDTWKRGGERLVNFPTDRPATSSRPNFFHPTYIYLNSPSERCALGRREEEEEGGY